MAVDRTTVDLAAYPDLVMILLGMRVNTATGLMTLLGFGPQIAKAARDVPDGLLSHETFLWSLFPPHVGIRQYWQDFEALETWSRSEPHRTWWKTFLRASGGTGFWHVSLHTAQQRVGCSRRARGPRPPTQHLSATDLRPRPRCHGARSRWR
jgi:hypothetical protein